MLVQVAEASFVMVDKVARSCAGRVRRPTTEKEAGAMSNLENEDTPTESEGGPTFADRLRFLFETVYPRGRGPYSQTEVVDMIRANGGGMTTGYMSQLLSGKRRSPTLPTVTDIATVFRVPIDYFGSPESYAEIRRHIAWISTIRDSGAEQVAARTYNPAEVFEVGFRELRRSSDEGDADN
ncbi:helix-turn-helix domain-containing protein [Nocardia sp. NPDC057272]|uniref:helix-turn-helix domain-containing protein n=1 Tax=Nocardia sp. NPDC057272 TaxID=3346079 RepID=UPI00363097BF